MEVIEEEAEEEEEKVDDNWMPCFVCFIFYELNIYLNIIFKIIPLVKNIIKKYLRNFVYKIHNLNRN